MTFQDVLRDWCSANKNDFELLPDAPEEAREIYNELYDKWKNPQPDENGRLIMFD